MGEGLNPIPYIAAAYLLAVVFFFGYAIWLLWDRARLERLLATLQPTGSSDDKSTRSKPEVKN